jgi:hypothetical protein
MIVINKYHNPEGMRAVDSLILELGNHARGRQ